MRALSWNNINKMVTIVTGASKNHEKSLLQLLDNLKEFAPDHRVIVYDFGELGEIKDTEVRKYDYANYPVWHDITKNAGEYAWKANAIWDVFQETRGIVLWLDSGDLLFEPLENNVLKILNTNGFYSPASSGSINDWTHPRTLFQLGGFHCKDRENRNGAIIGFNWEFTNARTLAKQWMMNCRRKHVIAPPGSSRANHRQDQSVLSVLAAKLESNKLLVVEDHMYGITIHNDCDD